MPAKRKGYSAMTREIIGSAENEPGRRHTRTGGDQNVLDIVDYVLVMSVNPGYGGQKFIPSSLRKVRELARMREERQLSFAIEIDGGVGMENIADVARAGVDWVVAGSSVFHAPDPAQAVRDMQRAAEEALSVRV